MRRAFPILLTAAAFFGAAAGSCPAQEALNTLLAGDAASLKAQSQQQQIQDYTLKLGDYRALLSAEAGADWNDNINGVKNGAQGDFILTPRVTLVSSYPITEQNIFVFNTIGGYDEYIQHSSLSDWYLQSGSQIALYASVQNFSFDVHDRFSFSQDATQQPGIAGTGLYGTFQNIAGTTASCDLNKLTLSLGYDHEIIEATTGQFSQDNQNLDMFTGRVSYQVIPILTTGLESSGSFSTYNENTLNNSASDSFGAFANWKVSPALSLSARGGISEFYFQQSSAVIAANNSSSFYLRFSADQQLTKTLHYTLSGGREQSGGVDTDLVQAWYAESHVTWAGVRDVETALGLTYQHASQSLGSVPGSTFSGERYSYLELECTASYRLAKNLRVSAEGRFTFRHSSVSANDYEQDLIGLRMTYQFL